MNIWLNKDLNGEEVGWKMQSGRRLILINKTGGKGRYFSNVNLRFMRNKRVHFIFLNHPKHTSSKTVGIFIWNGYYESYKGAQFVGKTKGSKGIDGMFGIYNIGTVIATDNGENWVLDKEKGWRQINE